MKVLDSDSHQETDHERLMRNLKHQLFSLLSKDSPRLFSLRPAEFIFDYKVAEIINDTLSFIFNGRINRNKIRQMKNELGLKIANRLKLLKNEIDGVIKDKLKNLILKLKNDYMALEENDHLRIYNKAMEEDSFVPDDYEDSVFDFEKIGCSDEFVCNNQVIIPKNKTKKDEKMLNVSGELKSIKIHLTDDEKRRAFEIINNEIFEEISNRGRSKYKIKVFFKSLKIEQQYKLYSLMLLSSKTIDGKKYFNVDEDWSKVSQRIGVKLVETREAILKGFQNKNFIRRKSPGLFYFRLRNNQKEKVSRYL